MGDVMKPDFSVEEDKTVLQRICYKIIGKIKKYEYILIVLIP